MTTYSACCAPLSLNDDRKPAFVGYADFLAVQAERDEWKRRAEEDERVISEVCSHLRELRTY